MLARRYFWLIAIAAVLCLGCPPSEEAPELAADAGYACSAPYTFPADLPEQTQVGADGFAWNSFLAVSAVDAVPAWKDWYSTVDTIECGQTSPPADGTCQDGKYYPAACVDAYPDSYAQYPVIDQVGKVDDDFEEAETKGLSSNPVIAANGTFLRYQIVISPGTHSWITTGGLQQETKLAANAPVNFPCDAGGAGDYSQAMSLKLAWMEMSNPLPTAQGDYYNQEMLLYTPGYRSARGADKCELKPMGLVGMHLVRKTASQPAWVWATFEHNLNAPLCTTEPDSGYKDQDNPAGQGSTNTSCPAAVDRAYNFHLADCSGDACAACNTGYDPSQADALAQNGKPYDPNSPLPQQGVCVNPEVAAEYQAKIEQGKSATLPPSWCVDEAPASSYGTSTLCRQVQPAGYSYTGAAFADTEPNQA